MNELVMEAMRQKHGAGWGLFQFPDLVTVVNIYHLVVVFNPLACLGL